MPTSPKNTEIETTVVEETPPVSQVPPVLPGLGMTHPDITMDQLEPGIVWAVANKQATVQDMVDKYGDHMDELLAEYK